jgi:hypothetical protein
MNTKSNPHLREGRSHASRLTVDLPRETLTALKIHAAAHETTIREVVTDLVRREIKGVRT